MSDKPSSSSSPSSSGGFPQAAVVDRGLPFRGAIGWWAAAAVCAAAAIVLMIRSWGAAGPEVTVVFVHGHGIEPGDPVRLRGIDVGLVESVAASEDLQQVRVELRLSPEAAALAREGTRFWIERPQVSLSAVRGLDTLVGPKYIGVQPGAPDAPRRQVFAGVEQPRQLPDSRGLGVTVRFREGYGLEVGAPVRFHGIQVGEVVDVKLGEELGEVLVEAELMAGAERLAREGSHFWVARPQLGVGEVRGLETLLGGRYLAVAPGPAPGEAKQLFEGLDTPPSDAELIGGLEVVLQSAERQGLQAGSPVLYRGVTVGNVVRVGLSSDGTRVESRIYIQSPYRQLIRSNTKFWSNGGLDVDFGIFKGLELGADSLETIAAGGVALATPDDAGDPVATGYRFPLADKPDDDWLDWRPPIPIGPQLGGGLTAPTPVRASLRWQRRSFGILRQQQREAWTHPLPGYRLLCPLDAELPDGLVVELQGETITVNADNVRRLSGLSLISKVPPPTGVEVWKLDRLRAPAAPEDCLLVAGPDSVPVSAGRLQPDDERPHVWNIDITVDLDADWHGAAVVSQSDASLLGAVLWEDGQALVHALRPEDLDVGKE